MIPPLLFFSLYIHTFDILILFPQSFTKVTHYVLYIPILLPINFPVSYNSCPCPPFVCIILGTYAKPVCFPPKKQKHFFPMGCTCPLPSFPKALQQQTKSVVLFFFFLLCLKAFSVGLFLDTSHTCTVFLPANVRWVLWKASHGRRIRGKTHQQVSI